MGLFCEILNSRSQIHRVADQGIGEPILAAHGSGQDLSLMNVDTVTEQFLPFCILRLI